ncbi:alpha/beta hydrolase family protein [Actinomadura chibensis]|uniref:Alpha/beta fold hydrolase n=1 Tax=Actinomadura chibensis TaxID=392828 RepID=A0A5D0NLF3_9ACTN|nr:alpha/beta hydrolase [Actinomadura chibensis]TYB45306.1 alpha/beta fold hydrolase [Actinomadura chibensis]
MRALSGLAAAAAVCAGTAGLAVPTAQAVPGKRGNLISVRPLATAAALPSASVNRAIRYTSEGVGGRKIVVTGTVAVPRGRPPRGGWPVLSWAHGTTGTADACAPSADTATGPAHDYLSITEAYLDRWVSRGYAVVQTDYEGLGTPGGHPYMNGVSEANTVVDIVRAARRVDRRIGRDWFVAGHSQGGQAALYTAATSAKDVRLRGAVAIAPGSNMSRTAVYVKSQQPGAEAALPFLFVLLNGAHAADPAFTPEALLTPDAAPLAAAGRTNACLAQLRQMSASLPLDKVFRPDADLTRFETYYNAQEALGLTLNVPTLVAQGTADREVSPAATRNIVDDLCERYARIAYRTFDGADHRGGIDASFETSLQFTESLRRGAPTPTTC